MSATVAPEAAHAVEILRIAGSVVAAIRAFFALLHVQWWLLIQPPKLSGKVETPGVLAICILHWRNDQVCKCPATMSKTSEAQGSILKDRYKA
jgi:hypothetical protein